MRNEEPRVYGDKTLIEWDRLWVRIPGGLKEYQPDLRYKVGLYRVLLNGRVMAIGTGTDKDGGIAKRLSDFFRPSDSSRRHAVGLLIYENRSKLVVEVLVVEAGSDARKMMRTLKAPMIKLHQPEWIVPQLFPSKAPRRQSLRSRSQTPSSAPSTEHHPT